MNMLSVILGKTNIRGTAKCWHCGQTIDRGQGVNARELFHPHYYHPGCIVQIRDQERQYSEVCAVVNAIIDMIPVDMDMRFDIVGTLERLQISSFRTLGERKRIFDVILAGMSKTPKEYHALCRLIYQKGY